MTQSKQSKLLSYRSLFQMTFAAIASFSLAGCYYEPPPQPVAVAVAPQPVAVPGSPPVIAPAPTYYYEYPQPYYGGPYYAGPAINLGFGYGGGYRGGYGRWR